MGFNNDRRGFGCASSAKIYTVEDYPLTLPDIKKLKTLSILGNSSQDGTPSPDNPIEVVGTGTRTGNLFDENKINKQNPTNQDIELKLDNNETYCLFSNINGGKGLIIIYAKTTGTDELKEIARNDTTQRFKNFVVDYTQYSGYILRWFAYSGENSINNIAIYKGSYTADTLPSYEPYGYKVSGLLEGLNLLDINSFKDTASSSDTSILLKSNTQYTFKFESLNSVVYVYDVDEQGEETQLLRTEIGNYTRTFQTGATGKIRIHLTNPSSTETLLSTWILVQGSYTAETMPSYEQYKEPQSFNVYTPEQLHGVGDAHDTVVLDFDRRKAQLIQEVSFGEFNGEENWYTNTEATNIQKYFLGTNIVKPGNTYNRPILSNIAVYSQLLNQKNKVNAYGFQNGNGWIGYCVDANVYPTVDDFKLYLQEMSSNDTPVRVYVDCKSTPTTTDITALQQWDNLPQLRGTWVLTAEGGTEPTLKATYTSNTDPYTDYSDIVSVLPVYPDLDIDTDDPTSEGENTEETEDHPETTSTDEPTSETNNSIDTIDILDLYE